MTHVVNAQQVGLFPLTCAHGVSAISPVSMFRRTRAGFPTRQKQTAQAGRDDNKGLPIGTTWPYHSLTCSQCLAFAAVRGVSLLRGLEV